MRKGLLEFYLMMAARVLAAGWVLLAASCLAQTVHRPTPKQEENLKTFLQDYLRDPVMGDDKTTQYSAAFVDLRNDGTQEAIVYITGRNWCGSGGCNTLILASKDSSYGVVTKILITRLPIRVLATKTNGWHDITVRVQGGGVIRAYEAKFSFNDKTYTYISSTRRLTEKVSGKVVVPLTAEGKPLYQ
jgi:hypothetical protein